MKFNISIQSIWWKYAAGTLPFIGLAIIVLLDIIGWTALHNKILFIILIGFFTSGVIWWWWAIDKIVRLTTLLINTEKKFDEIKTEIKIIKQEVKSLDRDLEN
jgi:Tfp pilus assembly protein PilO